MSQRIRKAMQAARLFALLATGCLMMSVCHAIQLQEVEGQDTRLNELLAGPLPEAPPAWLDDHGLCLKIAEQIYFHRRYVDVLTWLDQIEPNQVDSPELLFYLRAVAARQLVDWDTARDALDQLDSEMTNRLSVGRQSVVDQLRREVEGDDPEGLGLVSRLMDDAQRRLALTDVDQPTRDQQQRAIDELDELIKKLEEQQKKMQKGQAKGSSGGIGMPAEDSRPSDMKGPGEVDRKRFSTGDSWGDLPPAERERLAQEITQGYPPQYRSLISEYFEALSNPEGPQANEQEDGR